MKKKVTRDKNSLFYDIFIGEFIEVVLKIKTNRIEESEEGITQHTQPITISGFLLDYDGKRLYMGDEPDRINRAVKEVDVCVVQICDVINEAEEFLKSLPTPSKDEIN